MSVEVTGLSRLLEKLRTGHSRVERAVVAHIARDEVTPMVGHMHSRAGSVSRMAAKGAGHIVAQPTRDGAQLRATANEVTAGTEYGGGRRGKRVVASRSRSGRVYVMRRRTTRQFKPFLGKRGYWYWPTVRGDLRGIRRRILEVSVKALDNG